MTIKKIKITKSIQNFREKWMLFEDKQINKFELARELEIIKNDIDKGNLDVK